MDQKPYDSCQNETPFPVVVSGLYTLQKMIYKVFRPNWWFLFHPEQFRGESSFPKLTATVNRAWFIIILKSVYAANEQEFYKTAFFSLKNVTI